MTQLLSESLFLFGSYILLAIRGLIFICGKDILPLEVLDQQKYQVIQPGLQTPENQEEQQQKTSSSSLDSTCSWQQNYGSACVRATVSLSAGLSTHEQNKAGRNICFKCSAD